MNDGSAATPAYIAFEGSPLVVNAASGIRNNDTDIDNLTSSLTATKDTNPLHGTVTVNGDGSFTYTPTAGYLGGDSFTYHVNDPDPPGASVSLASNSATVFIDVQPRVWHIDNAFVGPGTGPLGSATNPFLSIDAFNTANAAAAAADKPDIVYLHDGTGTYTTTDGVNLFNGQTFLGQGVDLTYTTSASAPGGPQLITLANLDNTQIPVIQVTGGAGNAGITLAQNNTLAGFTIETTNAAGIGIEDSNAAGVAGSVGTLNVSLVGISGIGKAIDIDQGGTLNATFNSHLEQHRVDAARPARASSSAASPARPSAAVCTSPERDQHHQCRHDRHPGGHHREQCELQLRHHHRHRQRDRQRPQRQRHRSFARPRQRQQLHLRQPQRDDRRGLRR